MHVNDVIFNSCLKIVTAVDLTECEGREPEYVWRIEYSAKESGDDVALCLSRERERITTAPAAQPVMIALEGHATILIQNKKRYSQFVQTSSKTAWIMLPCTMMATLFYIHCGSRKK
jgi:hypothetical protein